MQQYNNIKENLIGSLKQIGELDYLNVRRDDISKSIDSAINSLLESKFQVCVFGEFKAGKSTFLNALLGKEILPMNLTRFTAAKTKLIFSENERVQIYWLSKQEFKDKIIDILNFVLNRIETFEELANTQFEIEKVVSSIKGNTNIQREHLQNVVEIITSDRRKLMTLCASSNDGTGESSGEELKTKIDTLIEINESFDKLIPGELIPYSSKIGEHPQEDKLENLKKYVTYHEDAGSRFLYLDVVDVYLNNKFLYDGIELIDLPGTAISRRDDQIAVQTAGTSDVIIILTSANQPLGKAEMEYLQDLYHLRGDNLKYFLVLVNRIDSASNHNGHEDTWHGRIKIMNGVREKLVKKFGTVSIEPIAVSAFTVLEAINLNDESPEDRFKIYQRLSDSFLGWDVYEVEDGNVPPRYSPEELLSKGTPYPGGKTWNETEEVIFNYLLNNKGRIILGNNADIAISILAKLEEEIRLSKKNLNESIEEIQDWIVQISETDLKLTRLKPELREMILSTDEPDFDWFGRRVAGQIRSAIEDKIQSSTLAERNLHSHLYDNMLNWIQIQLAIELDKFKELDNKIANKQSQIIRKLKEHNIAIEYRSKSSGIEFSDVGDIGFALKVYEPEYIPGRAKVERRVSDSRWYNPFTWGSWHFETVVEGRPEQWIYRANEIRDHYRRELKSICDELSKNLCNQFKVYYSTNLKNVFEENFKAIEESIKLNKSLLEESKTTLQHSKSERDKKLVYFNQQLDRIEQIKENICTIKEEINNFSERINL